MKLFLSIMMLFTVSFTFAQGVADYGEEITWDESASMVDAYQAGQEGEVVAHTIGSTSLNDILSQNGAEGIMFFYGTKNGEPELIYQAVDVNNEPFGMNADLTLSNMCCFRPTKPRMPPPGTSTNDPITEVGGEILHADALAYVTTYQNNNSGPYGVVVGKNILNDILTQSGIEGVMFFYAIDTNGDKTLVYQGVTEFNEPSGMIADLSWQVLRKTKPKMPRP